MKNKSFSESFRHAFDGIKQVIKEERNMRIDIVAMLFVWSVLPFYNFSLTKATVYDKMLIS